MTPRNVRNILVTSNDVDMDAAFTAMAAFPTLEQAAGFLIAERGVTASVAHLDVLRRRFPERFEEARTRAAKLREQALAGDLQDAAAFAVEVGKLAVQRTMERLEADECKDPSRVARDLADVAAKAVDKKLILESRPSRITVTRSLDEIFNQLEVLKVIDGTAEELAE